MYKQLRLGHDEQQALFSLVEACHSAGVETDFKDAIYPLLGALVEHGRFACGIGSTPENRIIHFLNVNFPEDYVRRVISPDGFLLSPVAKFWLMQKAPQYFDLQDLSGYPAEQGWLEAVRDFGLRNLVAHGMSDIKNKAASYFTFADVTRWSPREESLLQVVVPHLHVALVNIFPTTAEAQGVSFTQREHEVLYWVRCGKSNDEIGLILGISPWTAKVHVRNIMKKLHATTRTQAVAKAGDLGLI